MGLFKSKEQREEKRAAKEQLRRDTETARNSTDPEGDVSNQILEGLGRMVVESNPPSVEVNYDDVGPAKVMVGHLNQNGANAQFTVVDFPNYAGTGERHVAVGVRGVEEPADLDAYHVVPKEGDAATHKLAGNTFLGMDELVEVRGLLKDVNFNQPGAVNVAAARHEQHAQENGTNWDGHILAGNHIAAAQSAPAIEQIPPAAEAVPPVEEQADERINAPS